MFWKKELCGQRANQGGGRADMSGELFWTVGDEGPN
jgi:hypothetical protein